MGQSVVAGATSVISTAASIVGVANSELEKPSNEGAYVRRLQVQRLPPSTLANTQNVSVQITEHKIIKEGALFTSDICYYVVQTAPMRWEVLRKF